MTKLVWIRHGRTDWNSERRAQGQSDIPLNEQGRQQARALALRMAAEGVDFIYSSDLSRAKETAAILAGALGLEVQTDSRLREMHKGETEGTTLEERIKRWGAGWESQPLGIENDHSVTNRGLAFVNEMVRTFPDKRIAVVSHGALIGLTVKELVPALPDVAHYHNTSITTITYNGSEWFCDLLNCAKHVVR
ncbi:histidine phosphatase family protein [Paenibacillus aurantius]|uniref:Histidine phosphatase family protein n=1 Tax=Paenibacillus aurantius TaxID=2918900 RepID=A0AA96RD84_9BACL|nr:histidine phosphatase family protein [Paenibacillus aurantius]WNQ08818.1 histidine phosphatase family protein [Paenibacillus aurantius]